METTDVTTNGAGRPTTVAERDNAFDALLKRCILEHAERAVESAKAQAEILRKRRDAHRQRMAEYMRERYRSDPEFRRLQLEKSKAAYEADPEGERERRFNYWNSLPEGKRRELNARSRANRRAKLEADPELAEKAREYARNYYANLPPEKKREYQERRTAKRRAKLAAERAAKAENGTGEGGAE